MFRIMRSSAAAVTALGLCACEVTGLEPRTNESHLVQAMDVVPAETDALLIRYADSVARVEAGDGRTLATIRPLDRVFFARAGTFFAVFSRTDPMQPRGTLTLYDGEGRMIWSHDDALGDGVRISDDGKVVMALGAAFTHGSAVIEFHDDRGAIVGAAQELGNVDPAVPQLATDGGLAAVPFVGAGNDGFVSIDDGLRAYDSRGNELWSEIAPDQHFTQQILITRDRVAASFFQDQGMRHSIFLYDRSGKLTTHVEPEYHREPFSLRASPDGRVVAAFGHHGVVVFDARTGTIRWEWEWEWEWEWDGVSVDEFLFDCAVDNDGSVVGVGYTSKTGRRVCLLDSTGNRSAVYNFDSNARGWGNPHVVVQGNDIFILDTGDNRTFGK